MQKKLLQRLQLIMPPHVQLCGVANEYTSIWSTSPLAVLAISRSAYAYLALRLASMTCALLKTNGIDYFASPCNCSADQSNGCVDYLPWRAGYHLPSCFPEAYAKSLDGEAVFSTRNHANNIHLLLAPEKKLLWLGCKQQQ